MKKVKTLQLEDKIQKLEDDFKKDHIHSLFNSVRKLEGKPRSSFMLTDENRGSSQNMERTI